MEQIRLGATTIQMELAEGRPARLFGFGRRAPAPSGDAWAYRVAEVRIAGDDHDYIESGRAAGSGVGGRLLVEQVTWHGDCHLEVRQRDAASGLSVSSHLRAEAGRSPVESWTVVENGGGAPVTLLSVSSFFLVGLAAGGRRTRGERLRILTPHNGWYAEFQWQATTAAALGLENGYAFGSRHYDVGSVGPWCSANYLPMGFVENAETGDGLLFEILHSGSWSWQIGDTADDYYLHLAGPTEAAHWWRTLAPGAHFESVHALVVPTEDGFDPAMAALTAWRRANRPAAIGAGQAPVVFNDYMNCLDGNPTEATVLPLIDAAAAAGAEIYCMDSGWYLPPDTRWSALLGWWVVEERRFPRGLRWLMDRIRAKGMVPGLWFEIEAMTESRPGFADLPDDWFFVRHGRRVQSHRRFQLDFRNPAVRAFADEAIALAVEELGCGYLKLDYNLNAGPGSELGAESWGQALLDYDRAFLAWLDALRARYPHVLLEHCASGGMRLCHPFLSRTHNASISDNGDPLQIAPIAAGSMTALLPEQAGAWALPMTGQSDEETAFAMVNGLLGRMILGGQLGEATAAQAALVAQAVAVHQSIRAHITRSVPFWPLGLPGFSDDWIALGLRAAEATYLAVWRRGGADDRSIPLPPGLGAPECLYPAHAQPTWRIADDALQVRQPAPSARLFRWDAATGTHAPGDDRR